MAVVAVEAVATSYTSGGTIDTLFGSPEMANEDHNAASALAGAFAVTEEIVVQPPAPEPISGAPARRASHELSLDNVFKADSVAPAPQPSAFSFDQFFSSPTPAAGVPVADQSQGTPEPASAEDIEQFNSWLQGLKKK